MGTKLDSSVKGDKMLINETERPATVAGCRSYGKSRLISFKSSCILDIVVATAVGGQSFVLAAPVGDATSAEPGMRVIAADVNAIRGPLDTSFKECVGAGRANEAQIGRAS